MKNRNVFAQNDPGVVSFSRGINREDTGMSNDSWFKQQQIYSSLAKNTVLDTYYSNVTICIPKKNA